MSSAVPVGTFDDAGRLHLAEMKLVLDRLSEGMMVADPAGNILMLNQAASNLFGFAENAPQIKDVNSLSVAFEYFLPDGSQLACELWPPRAVLTGNSVDQMELRTTRIDTHRSWVGIYRVSPVCNRQGQTLVYLTTITDITRQRRMETHALFLSRLSSTLFRLVDPDPIFATAAQEIGRYLQVDRCLMVEMDEEYETAYVHPDYYLPGQPSAQRLFRLNQLPPELVKDLKNCEPSVIPDLHGEPAAAAYLPLLDRFSMRSLVVVPYLRHGSGLALLGVSCSAPCDWSAEDVSFLQSVSDLVWLSIDNARLYQDLKRTEERMRLVAVNTGLAMYTNDLDLRYTWAYLGNQESQAEEMLGKRDSDLLSEQDARMLMQIKQRVLDTGISAHLEFDLELRGGNRLYDMTIEPLRSADEDVLGLTVVAFDITERRQAEKEARRSADQLETNRLVLKEREMERIKIAQDLHDGPLQTVMALSLDLSDALRIHRKNERVAKLQDIRARLQSLAQELRSFSAELRPPTLAPFGLEKTIRSHIEGFQSEHPELRIDWELMPDGQSLSDEIRLAMFRIYQHLLSNIVRHARAQQVSVHLTLDEAQVELEIQDDGQGFELPPSWLDLARQGHYGLVGIFERIEALDGRVLIRSSPGKGTLVRVIIPRYEPPDSLGSL